jgi:hypothetical protein
MQTPKKANARADRVKICKRGEREVVDYDERRIGAGAWGKGVS